MSWYLPRLAGSLKDKAISNLTHLTLLLVWVSVSYNEHESLMQQSNNELWFWKHPLTLPAFAGFASFSFLAACP